MASPHQPIGNKPPQVNEKFKTEDPFNSFSTKSKLRDDEYTRENPTHYNKDSSNKKSDRSDLYFLIGTTIFLIALFLIFAPTSTSHYEVEVYYTDTETYTEKVPYEVQEAYEVQEPYEGIESFTDTVPIEQSVPYIDYEEVVSNAPSGQYYASWDSNCSCTNYNLEWCIQLTCQVATTRYMTEIVYEKIEKERPVTKYRTVTKSRTVTKYRDVQNTRNVIKTKMEPREMEVNWLFGFKMPYKLHIF